MKPHSSTRPGALDAVARRLLNDFQRDLPLSPEPYRDIGQALGVDEAEVMARLRELTDAGAISRVGAVVRPNTVGASTLAAMTVPESRLEAVAARVSREPGVNHNYEREHALNLWFVIAAPDVDALERALERIEHDTGLEVLSLPLERDYHIDLAFELDWS